MPDDSVLPITDVILRGHDSVILVVATGLLDAAIKDNEVVNQLQKPPLLTQQAQMKIEPIVVRIGKVFFPRVVVLFRRLDRSVTQPLGIVPSHTELHRRKVVADECSLLVVEILPNTLGDRHARPFQLNNA